MSLGKVRVGTTLGTKASPDILAKLPPDAPNDPINCLGIYNPFVNGLFTAAGSDYVSDDSDTEVTAVIDGTEADSALLIATTAATGSDNNEYFIQPRGAWINVDAAKGRMIFEARIKQSAITANTVAFFLGLAEPKAAGDNVFLADDTAALADIDYIGFHVDQAAAGKVDTVYNTASSTQSVAQATVHTMVAATWVRFGMYYNPSDGRIYFYVDTAVQTTSLLYSADYVPNGELLTPTFAWKVGTDNTAYNSHLGYLLGFQMR